MQPASGPSFKLNFKMGDMVNPSPAQTWVFVDERENSINDGWFAVDMADTGSGATWVDLPATRHNHGAVFSFADGHAEYRKWQNAATSSTALLPNTESPNNPDIFWLQQRTTGTQ
jgi:prepilin-type processing-associated H-X9-DG protein